MAAGVSRRPRWPVRAGRGGKSGTPPRASCSAAEGLRGGTALRSILTRTPLRTGFWGLLGVVWASGLNQAGLRRAPRRSKSWARNPGNLSSFGKTIGNSIAPGQSALWSIYAMAALRAFACQVSRSKSVSFCAMATETAISRRPFPTSWRGFCGGHLVDDPVAGSQSGLVPAGLTGGRRGEKDGTLVDGHGQFGGAGRIQTLPIGAGAEILGQPPVGAETGDYPVATRKRKAERGIGPGIFAEGDRRELTFDRRAGSINANRPGTVRT